jgi:WD40 repeat protein
MLHDLGTSVRCHLVFTSEISVRQWEFASGNRARLLCEMRTPAPRERSRHGARVRPLASAMKLSPLAHQAGAHDDGAWAVAWCKSSDGDDLLLTGSVDESVRSWRATGDGLEVVHEYQGACGGTAASRSS